MGFGKKKEAAPAKEKTAVVSAQSGTQAPDQKKTTTGAAVEAPSRRPLLSSTSGGNSMIG